MTEFVLIRHGETDWNRNGRYQGVSDVPLNELGVAQTEALAEALQGESWDHVISSPLERARVTAAAAARGIGFPESDIVIDDRLIERNFGVAEGLFFYEREKDWPGAEWPEHEPITTVRDRALAAMNDIAGDYPGERVMLVGHGRWIMECLYMLSDGQIELPGGSIPNTSRTYVSHDTDGWTIGEIGVDSHLATLV